VWFCRRGSKEAAAKASAMRYEWLLPREAKVGMSGLCVGLATVEEQRQHWHVQDENFC